MLRVVFHKSRDGFSSVRISGHAGFAAYGSDIVCASVTSAVQMTANGITEVLHAPAQVEVEDNLIAILLGPDSGQCAWDFLAALHLHLEILSQQYTNNIKLTILEV